ncbi:PWWP domain [Macleaya cordata]|uniref:PWWP domain n=1 Tax=Macleaya cordata TaxID=56857 RepID=A0A200PLW1_MACCD|nr:PWWP domain [Macleaya cordata]
MVSVMNNDCELEVKSDVISNTEIPLLEVKSAEEEETAVSVVDDMMIDKSVIDSLNGVPGGGGRFDSTVVIVTTTATISQEARVSLELDKVESSTVADNVFDVGHVLEKEKTGFEEVTDSSEVYSREIDSKKMESRVSSEEVDSRDMDRKWESRVSEIIKGEEEIRRNDDYAVGDSELGQLIGTAGEGGKISSGETKKDIEMMEKSSVSDFRFAYSMVDEGYAARMSEAFGLEAAKALSYGFEPGDMVWGKVKSHPWWPGHIFNEAFASSSVRRTKRGGHVLVAFFGDSSYGWFDPAELIPFDPHYSEKSRQTNSRIFMKAVEEAVDEARRRAALGLVCCCRNPFNFRPANVRGYFTVNVADYEGGIYSVKEIKKARDNFQPGEALSFVQQLAMRPRNNDQKGIDWIKNVAMFLALRKATYEEFDETYAQAFGTLPVRPDRDAGVVDQAAKVPFRAPLSGPMVMAEALGEMKSSSKLSKVKDKSKKDMYVLKRREKPSEPKVHQYSSHASNASFAYKGGPGAIAPEDYIFQKRTSAVLIKPQVSLEQEGIQTISRGDPALTLGETGQESETAGRNLVFSKFSTVHAQINMNRVDLPVASAVGSPITQPAVYNSISVSQGDPQDMNVLHEMNGRVTPTGDVGPTSTSLDDYIVLGRLEAAGTVDSFVQNLRQESKAVDLKQESAKLSTMSEVLEQSKQPLKDRCGADGVWGFGDRVLGTNFDGAVKKAKAFKHPENLTSDITGTAEKKKKKKRKLGSEAFQDHPRKLLRTVKGGESVRKSEGKSIGIGLVPVVAPPEVDLANIKVELPQLVDDLLALALDPFHGVERNGPAIVRHVLLQFRSLVYQKSLVLAPVTEPETSNLDRKSPSGSAPAKVPSGVSTKDPRPKLQKPSARPDDPTKAGRKRSLSDRQEEKSAKRLKKLNELKSLTTEKKAGTPKIQEPKQEHKEAVVTVPPKLTRPDTVKKAEQLARAVEPAMLVLKFPPRTTLPSVPELKARFARFGPLDHSALRVFWKSFTCRVVFKHKSHASAAYNYAVRNKSLFGQVKVNYQLRDVVVPGAAAEVPESVKCQLDDNSDEVPSIRHGADNTDYLGDQQRQKALIQRRPQQPAVQLKSCLKKPSGEETGGSAMDGGVPRENPRVRFKLGGDESDSRREEMMVSTTSSSNNKKNNSSSSTADDGGGSLSSSLAMDDDVISKNYFQKVIPPQIQQFPPLLSSSLNNQQQQQQPSIRLDMNESLHGRISHFTKSSSSSPPYFHHHHHHCHQYYNQVVVEEEQKNIDNNTQHNLNTIITNNTKRIDISSQMLSLLMRCNDIVMDVSSSLGYVPYHPL